MRAVSRLAWSRAWTVRSVPAAPCRPAWPLALTATRPDEAAHLTLEAVTSGRLVPSSHWRAAETIGAVRNVPEAADLQEAYRALT